MKSTSVGQGHAPKPRGHPGEGQNALIWKIDGKRALVAARGARARCHGGSITPEILVHREHQADDVVEASQISASDHARVLKSHLQSMIGREVEVREPLTPWLIRWASMSLSRFKRGNGGKTPDDERQRGHRCDIAAVSFGEALS